jgi:hypothetical protein
MQQWHLARRHRVRPRRDKAVRRPSVISQAT